MSKYRFTIDVDLERVGLENAANVAGSADAAAEAVFVEAMVQAARLAALDEFRSLQNRKDLSTSERAARMAASMNRAKLALQAEANMTVKKLPDDVIIHDDTPERVALAA